MQLVDLPTLCRESDFISLHAPLLPPRLSLRYRITAELLARQSIPHQQVEAWGEGSLAQLVSAIAYGDWTSYYLALLSGVDPTGIAAIDYLKARLAEAG